jgi:hypothetical protein
MLLLRGANQFALLENLANSDLPKKQRPTRHFYVDRAVNLFGKMPYFPALSHHEISGKRQRS